MQKLLASAFRQYIRLFAPYCITLLLIYCICKVYVWGITRSVLPTIIVITPTHRRPERLADMTRFSQTLSHIEDLHWVVIEDGSSKVDAVERILQRSGIPYVYFFTNSQYGFPKRGWTHRNFGLSYVRKNYANYNKPAVVYFGDDDNSYDIRLFNNYIRNVKTIGIWAVGLAGAALVEAPRIENGTIVGFDVVYAPKRKFATDMAGFAINLKEILRTNATFHRGCIRKEPETCFLDQFKIPKEEMQAFGYDSKPKDILVWHTKTRNIGTMGSKHGYVIEDVK